jgi:hypothetical protein
MIRIDADLEKLDKTLQEYVLLNNRATNGLVEHTLRKVVTGFSPRSKSAKKIKGLRQVFYEKRATRTKIVQEFKKREAIKKGTRRPPKHYVSPTAKRERNKKYPKLGLGRTKWQAIGWRSRRGTAWVQATMLYRNWRPNDKPKNIVFKPTLDAKHGGKLPPSGVRIKTGRMRASATWYSKLEAVVKNKHYRRARSRALQNVRADMQEYINRKHQEILRRRR